MGKLDSNVDALLKKMHAAGKTGVATNKGSIGEQAVIKVCEEFYQSQGGILIHSYTYKTDKDQLGNIKRGDNGNFFVENLGDITEVDVLFVSKFRVFPIEVKAYKAKQIRIDDAGIYGCYKTDKSPIHQNEMHCRHLYPHIYRALPEGSTDYVCPVVVFVDQTDLVDERSEWQREYIKACTLDNLRKTIAENNYPLDYQLNLTLVNNILKEAMIKNELYLPPRL